MSKTAYYQTDFKPDYQLFQQKISQLSSQKSRITKKEINLQKLQHQLQLTKQQIEDQGLQYDNSNLFVRYASIQQLAQKKKSASDCCVHCGQEMKKSVQCEYCAQLYCKNCCWRKRVIPFQEHSDFRLCCQQCHEKYIKHFNNQDFYKEKGIVLAAIDQLQRKYEKTKVKYEKKETEVRQYKQQKRAVKIKEGNLKKALLEQQKRIKQLNEEFQRAVQQKALRLKQQEQRLRNQDKNLQQLRQRQQQEQRQRQFQQQQKRQQEKQIEQRKRAKQLQEEQARLLQNSRMREEELAKRQAEIKREKQQLQRERQQLSESRLKQLEKTQRESIQTTKQQQKVSQTVEKQSPIKNYQQEDKQSKKSQKIVTPPKQEAPRKIVFNDEIDFDAILKVDEKEKVPQVKQVKQEPKEEKTQIIEKTKEQNKQSVTLKDLLKQIKVTKNTDSKIESPKKEEEKQQKSQKEKSVSQQVSESPRLTMNQIKTMSINDLLSMKIPMNPNANQSKRPRKSSHPDIQVDAEENSTTTQNQKMYQSLLEPGIPQQSFLVGLALPSQNFRESSEKQQNFRLSIRSVHEQIEDDMNEKDKENQKKALLRKQSLISSSNKVSIVKSRPPSYHEDQPTIGEPQKCTCEIM